MPTLHLNLKKKWFDMIASGEKKEEYRDIKDYWERRIFDNPLIETITFSNGFAKNRRQMVVDWMGLEEGIGNKNWGAPDHKVFMLRLGKIISRNF